MIVSDVLRSAREICAMRLRLRVKDVAHGDQVANRGIVMQHKTRRPTHFEITWQTRDSVSEWITLRRKSVIDLFRQSHR